MHYTTIKHWELVEILSSFFFLIFVDHRIIQHQIHPTQTTESFAFSTAKKKEVLSTKKAYIYYQTAHNFPKVARIIKCFHLNLTLLWLGYVN